MHNVFSRGWTLARKQELMWEKTVNLTWVIILVYVCISSERKAKARRDAV